MCGIAGRILNAPGRVGRDLVALMAAQEHRGADSTGFAVYGAPMEKGYVLRGMGFNKAQMDADLDLFSDTLKEHDSYFLSDPIIVTDENKHYCFRMEISDPRNIAAWTSDADELSGRIEIQSCGRSLEIVKDIGGAEQVGETYYYCPLNINIFGICDCSTDHLHAYVYHEGAGKKGGDNVCH